LHDRHLLDGRDVHAPVHVFPDVHRRDVHVDPRRSAPRRPLPKEVLALFERPK
jgi:hypothetical protein